MNSKSVLVVASATIIAGIILTYFILEPDGASLKTTNDISTIEITQIKLNEEGEGEIFTSAESDLFYVYAYESDLVRNSKGQAVAKFMHFKLKKENEVSR